MYSSAVISSAYYCEADSTVTQMVNVNTDYVCKSSYMVRLC